MACNTFFRDAVTMRIFLRAFPLLLILLAVCACGMPHIGTLAEDEVVLGETAGTTTIVGTVNYVQIEGGFWAIRGGEPGSESMKTYEPVNLPESFQVDGLPVEVRALVRKNQASFRQVGPIIEIRSIAPATSK